MEHYYTQNPNTPHHLGKISYHLHQSELEFLTDSGVFSKKKVDFGSDLLIRTLPQLNGKILDLGCGYGVIGISLAILNPLSHVTLVDINERAVHLANQNIHSHRLTNAVAVQSDGFTQVTGSFDTIVSNPPIRAGKKVIYPLFEESIRFLNPGGFIYLVIQKKQGAKSAVDKLQEIFGNCDVIAKEGGYWILQSMKKEKESPLP